MEINIKQIDDLIKQDELAEALELISSMLKEEQKAEVRADILFRRGKIHWKMGNRSRATSDYMAAVELDPSSPAGAALEQARDIERFFNPDLLNP